MKKTRLSALLIGLGATAAMLAGCGGDDDTAPGESSVSEEASYYIDDFLGSWEYVDYPGTRITVYNDYELEWVNGDYSETHEFYINENGEMVVVDMYTYSVDGDGLIDNTGDRLIPYDDPYQDSGDIEYDADYFVGNWESWYGDRWLIVYYDGEYQWYGLDGVISEGLYEVDGNTLILDDGLSLSIDEDGDLSDESGDEVFYSCSELPDGEPEEDSSIDASEYCGSWETSLMPGEWLCINEDGTYEWYNEYYGFVTAGDYTVAGGKLTLDDGTEYAFTSEYEHINSTDGAMTFFRSGVPDSVLNAEPSYIPTEEDFVGTWEKEYEEGDERTEWRVIYPDGITILVFDDGPHSMSEYRVYNGVLSGTTRFVLDESGNLVGYDGTTYFPSETPSELDGAISDTKADFERHLQEEAERELTEEE